MVAPVGPARRSSRFDFIAGAGPFATPGDQGSVWWRVTAANNRALARSVDAFGSLADCRDNARTVQSRIDELVPTFASDGHGRWTWSAALDATAAVRSARPFARRIDCVRTLALFIDAARRADVDAADVRRLVARTPGGSAHPVGR